MQMGLEIKQHSPLAADAISAIPFAWLRQQNEAMRFATLRLLSIGVNIGLNLLFYLIPDLTF